MKKTRRPKTAAEFKEAVQTAAPGDRLEVPEPQFI